eukprot:scaffold4317_cov323-Prasinococcus_capsulatus_cf.AAC.2
MVGWVDGARDDALEGPTTPHITPKTPILVPNRAGKGTNGPPFGYHGGARKGPGGGADRAGVTYHGSNDSFRNKERIFSNSRRSGPGAPPNTPSPFPGLVPGSATRARLGARARRPHSVPAQAGHRTRGRARGLTRAGRCAPKAVVACPAGGLASERSTIGRLPAHVTPAHQRVSKEGPVIWSSIFCYR